MVRKRKVWLITICLFIAGLGLIGSESSKPTITLLWANVSDPGITYKSPINAMAQFQVGQALSNPTAYISPQITFGLEP